MHSLPYEIECKECGCLDVEVEHEPTPGEWFPSGRARCNACGSHFVFRAPEPGKEPAEEFGDAARYLNGRGGAVIYRPVRCPKCRSTDVLVQHTEAPVRYHRCRNCGETFKSVEQ
jgi:ribosomal protein S27E